MSFPVYVRNDADGRQWVVDNGEDVQLESLVLKHAVRTVVHILWSTQLSLNDALTRKSVADRVNAYVNERCVSRVLDDGKAVCDESNNPPSRVDNNQVVVTLAFKLRSLVYQFSFSNKPL